jgi:NAD(P)-dependent dehydrogenase (short-subunit alcohol dehydrogenase family)
VSVFDLTGKAAVVTGSSRGIGRAIVERMAEHGARGGVSSRHVENRAALR